MYKLYLFFIFFFNYLYSSNFNNHPFISAEQNRARMLEIQLEFQLKNNLEQKTSFQKRLQDSRNINAALTALLKDSKEANKALTNDLILERNRVDQGAMIFSLLKNNASLTERSLRREIIKLKAELKKLKKKYANLKTDYDRLVDVWNKAKIDYEKNSDSLKKEIARLKLIEQQTKVN